MADNYDATQGSGTTFGADDVSGVLYPRVKLQIGADGERADVDGGQQAMANSVPVVIASDQTVLPAGGNIAHDAADSGNPLKIGGKASSSRPAAVANNDRVNAYFDSYGRLAVNVDRVGGINVLQLTPGDPNPTGTDITDDAGSVIEAADLTVRDSNNHAFFIPMSGFRSLLFYIENDGTAWDVAPTVVVYGAFTASGGLRGAQLASFTGVVTASNRIVLGISPVGQGGLTGSDPVPGTFYYYPIPAMADGWPYIAVYLKFASAPSQGEFDDIYIVRQV